MIKNIAFSSDDNYIDSLFEQTQLEYELYLIETEAFTTCNKINKEIVQEAYGCDMEILNESIKETLTLWLARFTEAMQKALDNFIGAIEGAQDLAYLKSIEPSVKNLKEDPGFEVNNIRNYKSDMIKNFKVIDFNSIMTNNRDSLSNQENFLITNYPNLGFAQNKTDIKQVIESEFVEVVTQPVNVTVELINGYYNWCRNDYINDINPIKQAMNTYNTSTKTIQNLVSNLPDDYRDNSQTENNPNVTPKNQPGTDNANASFQNWWVHEDDTTANKGTANNGPKYEIPNKMTFDDKVDYIAKAKGTNQDIVTMIKTYLSCTTRILGTMFIIIKNRKADYLRVLKHLFPVNKQMRADAGATATMTRTNNQVDTSKIPGNT